MAVCPSACDKDFAWQAMASPGCVAMLACQLVAGDLQLSTRGCSLPWHRRRRCLVCHTLRLQTALRQQSLLGEPAFLLPDGSLCDCAMLTAVGRTSGTFWLPHQGSFSISVVAVRRPAWPQPFAGTVPSTTPSKHWTLAIASRHAGAAQNACCRWSSFHVPMPARNLRGVKAVERTL